MDNENVTPVDTEEQKQQPKDSQEQEKPKENDINDIVKKQMEQFQTQFMEQFQEQFNDKINKFEDDKKDFQSAKQKHQIKELLMENNLESNLLDYVYDNDVEVVKLKINEINTIINNRVEKIVTDRLKENSYTPPSSNESFNNDRFNKPSYMV
ncbi:hypothetical protein FDF18_12495 [Clostridium sporogenes]|uniref:hypothetical protein n=1 Tax=Clostridium sporogenes TaxID=1509 RepID=UPI0013CDCD9D|nr:hypothetical protein [Clostridium sporogenes]NFT04102.1 hypothetical protein [Clostridium sporogenes]NFT31287.1 hypothetical protein [Clostridium sporogenes]NFT39526.1 hypothetical protein [Clostridium sporogenes]NFT54603.1 hypothetical protein [Clostridium sporogenes]NFT75756.1 hypothetical protein [Clostridium sporogenes]